MAVRLSAGKGRRLNVSGTVYVGLRVAKLVREQPLISRPEFVWLLSCFLPPSATPDTLLQYRLIGETFCLRQDCTQNA